MTYEDLQEALVELDLPPQATLQLIRERHRQLVREHHPDRGGAAGNEKIRRINAAYRVINDYLSRYRFDFSRKTFMELYPEEKLRRQFYDVGLWGG